MPTPSCVVERREDLAENPANRLRLTVGLRKEAGRWVVAHEHHSFPDADTGDTPGEAKIDVGP